MSNENKSSLQQFSETYGAPIVGLVGAALMLLAAYAMPAYQHKLVTAAGVMGFVTLFARGRTQWGYRALGMVGAALCLSAAFFMPDQAKELVNTGTIVAVISLFFW